MITDFIIGDSLSYLLTKKVSYPYYTYFLIFFKMIRDFLTIFFQNKKAQVYMPLCHIELLLINI